MTNNKPPANYVDQLIAETKACKRHAKFRPMLAALCRDINTLHYPVLVTPKIDGIRCVTLEREVIVPNDDGVDVLTRSLKNVPNNFIRQTLSAYGLPNLDGELVVGENFQMSSSGIMSENGQPNFTYWIFDLIMPHLEYVERMHQLCQMGLQNLPHIKILTPTVIDTPAQLLAYEQAMLEMKFEGVMIRSMTGPYKFGRSTEKQSWLLKLKRFADDEAIIIGHEELYRNYNESTVGPLGLSERSDHAENKMPAGVLGAFRVRNRDGVEFNVGSGFTDIQRSVYWDKRDAFVGQWLKYKFQNFGIKTAPRHPVFLGIRDARDSEDPTTGTSEGELF
jgi:DNA ligase-1